MPTKSLQYKSDPLSTKWHCFSCGRGGGGRVKFGLFHQGFRNFHILSQGAPLPNNQL